MIEININSYVTLDEANEYFATRLGSDYWGTLDDVQKEKALITATKKIDRLPFIGYKQDPNQPLQFPRFYYATGCYCNGLQIADIPQQLKDAVCEEALTTLQYIENNSEDIYNGALSGNYQSLKLGDATITYGSGSGSNSSNGNSSNNYGLLSYTAYDLLQGLIKIGYNITNPVYYEGY